VGIRSADLHQKLFVRKSARCRYTRDFDEKNEKWRHIELGGHFGIRGPKHIFLKKV
jgi:hypothetical protein